MGLFSQILNFARLQSENNKKSLFIFYKIVGLAREGKGFVLQCIKTNAIFNATIIDIVFDLDILHGLHPVQACYIGIEYATYFKKANCLAAQIKLDKKINSVKYIASRYGTFQIDYQDRQRNISFSNRSTGQIFLMDPRDIALSDRLIQEFDAAEAFYIGVFAGLKLNSSIAKRIDLTKLCKHKKSHLRLVKT